MNTSGHAFKPLTWLAAAFMTVVVAGCGGGGGGDGGSGSGAGGVLPGVAGTAGAAATNPTVTSAGPANGATNVATSTKGTGNTVTGKQLTATFSQTMDPTTVTPVGVFTLKTTAGVNVPGTVTMNAANRVATFTPTAAALLPNTQYTATMSTAARSAVTPGPSTAMPSPVSWSFTTSAALSTAQGPVNLLTAGNFVILAKTKITNVPTSAIVGDIGLSPAAGSFIDVACSEMTGSIYTVDATYVVAGFAACVKPGPGANKTLVDQAILDMGTARGDLFARSIPTATELGAGNISGLTITPGLYKWSTDVNINTNVTLSGSPDDVWIFQIDGDLNLAAGGGSVATGIKVVLAGGALAKNVFWGVNGLTGATLNTFSTFNGIILSAKQTVVKTSAVVNGRLYADSQATLEMNPVTQPAP